MPQEQRTSMTAGDYLAMELGSRDRHEYVAGEIYAMNGASKRHNLIAGNLYYALREAGCGKRCHIFVSEVKLRVEAVDAFYYPDLIVTCDPTDRDELFVERPCLVVEVLSPSTAGTDRREKLHAYRTLPSLQEYALIDQDRLAVWIYRRGGDGWMLEKLGTGDSLRLESLNVALSLDEIYDRVELPEKKDIREEEAAYMLM